ncbi:MAG: GTP-binding protein [Xanthobacteraceae bacterium]
MTVRPDPGAFALESFLARQERKSLLRFVVCGSVDHGKSTLIGRLLYEAKLLFEDQLDALAASSRRVGAEDGELDFSLLLDGLAAEREQKITIDVAYRFFTTDKRKFIVADAPGHEQYTRHMATGASTADLALILVNAAAGLTAQTKRHSLIVSTLGVRRLVVAVNKMDLVDWSQAAFAKVEADFRALAADLHFADIVFIPVAARSGDNVVSRSSHMDWYRGPTLLAHLEQVEIAPAADGQRPFRMPVQWVNRPHAEFRGYCGLVAGGEVYAGMPVQIWPSGRMVHVERIITAGGEADLALAGESVTLTFEEDVDASRGDVLAETGAAPQVSDRLAARMVWMSEEPLASGGSYLLKVGTCTAKAMIEPDVQVIDLDSRESRPSRQIAHNEIGTCVLQLDRVVCVDRYGDNQATGSFILLDPESYDTIAIGTIEAAQGRRETGRAAHPAMVPVHPTVRTLLARASESRLRSATKALTWRLIASVTAFAVALMLTGSIGIAGSVALVDIVGRTILYYVHERLWSKVAWGTR